MLLYVLTHILFTVILCCVLIYLFLLVLLPLFLHLVTFDLVNCHPLCNLSFIYSFLLFPFQKRNCQELIWLLASYNFIEDATNLALDLIDAILGKGSDLFNLDVTLTTYEEYSPIYVPHNQVQNLLSILQTSKSTNSDLENLYNSLNQKMRTLEDILLRESKI